MTLRAAGAAATHSAPKSRNDGSVDLGPLPGLIGYALRRAQLAVFQDFIRELAVIKIRPAQFSVLLVIEANPGLKQSEVSAALGIQRTNFVALFDGLERRGLARRAPAASDRRSHALRLTERGEQLLRRMKALHQRHEERLAARLGESGRRTLLSLLAKITELDR